MNLNSSDEIMSRECEGVSATSVVIPGRAEHEPGIHTHDGGYGFRARAKRRVPE